MLAISLFCDLSSPADSFDKGLAIRAGPVAMKPTGFVALTSGFVAMHQPQIHMFLNKRNDLSTSLQRSPPLAAASLAGLAARYAAKK